MKFPTAIFALSLILLVGCGHGPPFETVPVSGTITYGDGMPIDAAHVRVHFQPVDAAPVGDHHPRPGEAELDSRGRFAAASTLSNGDGVIHGRHKVILETADADWSPRPEAVAERYTDPAATPLEIIATRGGPNHFILIVERGP